MCACVQNKSRVNICTFMTPEVTNSSSASAPCFQLCPSNLVLFSGCPKSWPFALAEVQQEQLYAGQALYFARTNSTFRALIISSRLSLITVVVLPSGFSRKHNTWYSMTSHCRIQRITLRNLSASHGCRARQLPGGIPTTGT